MNMNRIKQVALASALTLAVSSSALAGTYTSVDPLTGLVTVIGGVFQGVATGVGGVFQGGATAVGGVVQGGATAVGGVAKGTGHVIKTTGHAITGHPKTYRHTHHHR